MLTYENSLLSKVSLGEKIPVSIATANAIESILGIRTVTDFNGKKVKYKPEYARYLKEFTEVHVNIRTLLRNLTGSLDQDGKEQLVPYLLAEGLVYEIKELIKVFEEYAPSYMKLRFYHCDYSDISKIYPAATLREPVTPKQIHESTIEKKVLDHFFKLVKNIDRYKTELKGKFGKTIIFTNFPIDLLSYDNFSDLKLLESHTGIIKGRSEWYTKFSSKDVQLPFNRLTLQVFGDSRTFKSQPAAVKKEIIKISVVEKWHPLTKESSVVKDVKNSKAEKEIREKILDLI